MAKNHYVSQVKYPWGLNRKNELNSKFVIKEQ